MASIWLTCSICVLERITSYLLEWWQWSSALLPSLSSPQAGAGWVPISLVLSKAELSLALSPILCVSF